MRAKKRIKYVPRRTKKSSNPRFTITRSNYLSFNRAAYEKYFHGAISATVSYLPDDRVWAIKPDTNGELMINRNKSGGGHISFVGINKQVHLYYTGGPVPVDHRWNTDTGELEVKTPESFMSGGLAEEQPWKKE
jgi:hypothetical protein